MHQSRKISTHSEMLTQTANAQPFRTLYAHHDHVVRIVDEFAAKLMVLENVLNMRVAVLGNGSANGYVIATP